MWKLIKSIRFRTDRINFNWVNQLIKLYQSTYSSNLSPGGSVNDNSLPSDARTITAPEWDGLTNSHISSTCRPRYVGRSAPLTLGVEVNCEN